MLKFISKGDISKAVSEGKKLLELEKARLMFEMKMMLLTECHQCDLFCFLSPCSPLCKGLTRLCLQYFESKAQCSAENKLWQLPCSTEGYFVAFCMYRPIFTLISRHKLAL